MARQVVKLLSASRSSVGKAATRAVYGQHRRRVINAFGAVTRKLLAENDPSFLKKKNQEELPQQIGESAGNISSDVCIALKTAHLDKVELGEQVQGVIGVVRQDASWFNDLLCLCRLRPSSVHKTCSSPESLLQASTRCFLKQSIRTSGTTRNTPSEGIVEADDNKFKQFKVNGENYVLITSHSYFLNSFLPEFLDKSGKNVEERKHGINLTFNQDGDQEIYQPEEAKKMCQVIGDSKSAFRFSSLLKFFPRNQRESDIYKVSPEKTDRVRMCSNQVFPEKRSPPCLQGSKSMRLETEELPGDKDKKVSCSDSALAAKMPVNDESSVCLTFEFIRNIFSVDHFFKQAVKGGLVNNCKTLQPYLTDSVCFSKLQNHLEQYEMMLNLNNHYVFKNEHDRQFINTRYERKLVGSGKALESSSMHKNLDDIVPVYTVVMSETDHKESVDKPKIVKVKKSPFPISKEKKKKIPVSAEKKKPKSSILKAEPSSGVPKKTKVVNFVNSNKLTFLPKSQKVVSTVQTIPSPVRKKTPFFENNVRGMLRARSSSDPKRSSKKLWEAVQHNVVISQDKPAPRPRSRSSRPPPKDDLDYFTGLVEDLNRPAEDLLDILVRGRIVNYMDQHYRQPPKKPQSQPQKQSPKQLPKQPLRQRARTSLSAGERSTRSNEMELSIRNRIVVSGKGSRPVSRHQKAILEGTRKLMASKAKEEIRRVQTASATATVSSNGGGSSTTTRPFKVPAQRWVPYRPYISKTTKRKN